MTLWVDGQFVAARPAQRREGVAPFETMGAVAGELRLWDLHLARLSATMRRLALPFAPSPGWRPAARTLLRQNGHTEGVLRLACVPSGGAVRIVMATRPRSPLSALRLLPTVVEPPADRPPGDLKAEPRAYYDLVRQQAQDGGADDGIVIAADGAVLECALGNLFLRLDGTWCTPPLDGRVLPGIARALLLNAAAAQGQPIRERACGLGDLHAATALAHSNAVSGPRAACLVGGVPAVEICDSELGALWRRVASA